MRYRPDKYLLLPPRGSRVRRIPLKLTDILQYIRVAFEVEVRSRTYEKAESVYAEAYSFANRFVPTSVDWLEITAFHYPIFGEGWMGEGMDEESYAEYIRTEIMVYACNQLIAVFDRVHPGQFKTRVATVMHMLFGLGPLDRQPEPDEGEEEGGPADDSQ